MNQVLMKFSYLAIAISLAILPTFAKADIQDIYNNNDLLSASENQVLANLIKAKVVGTTTGQYAIIYPDETAPVAGAVADDMFRSGQVQIITFSALPNDFMGSMNVGKLIAQVNHQPVLAVHSGYGDPGIVTEGPQAFYLERLANMNQQITSLGQDAINPLLKLLNSTPAANISELHLVAYCLGAYKAAQVGWHLEKSNPDLLAKTTLLTLGLGVFHSDKFKFAFEWAGNRDQFGRINSTNLTETVIIRGKNHPIRIDSQYDLPVPAVADVPTLWQEALLRSETIEMSAFTPQDMQNSIDILSSQISEFKLDIAEANSISDAGLTDNIHLNKLQWELARATRNLDLFSAALAQANGDTASSQSFSKKATAVANSIQTYIDTDSNLEALRTGYSDTLEYEAWAMKTQGGTVLQ